jgi:hypothetical protein
MTLLTSPENRSDVFVATGPQILDSLYSEYSELSVYYATDSSMNYYFPDVSLLTMGYIPRVLPPTYGHRVLSGQSDVHAKSYYHKKPISAMLAGTFGTGSYGHTSSVVYQRRLPDKTRPRMEILSQQCGSFAVRIVDDVIPNQQAYETGKLAVVRPITSVHDIKNILPMRNFRIVRTADFVIGSQTDEFQLDVINPSADAFAPIYVQDLSGNDTVFIINYSASHSTINATKLSGVKVPAGRQGCVTMTLYPKQDPDTKKPVYIEDVRFKSNLSQVTITSVQPSLPYSFETGDSLVITICTNFKDTVASVVDSLIVRADCYDRAFPISLKGATGLLQASDVEFLNVKPSTPVVRTVTLVNKGELPLTIQSYTLDGSSAFSVDPSISLPMTIQKNSFRSVKIMYNQSQSNAKDTAVIQWQTDIASPYDQSLKVFTIASGNTTGSVSVVGDGMNTEMYFSECFPNPANDQVRLIYQSETGVHLTVSDQLGRVFDTLQIPAGSGTESVHTSRLPAGNYILIIRTNGLFARRAFTILR